MVYADIPDAGSLVESVHRDYFGDGYLRKRAFFTDWPHRWKARRRLEVIRRHKPGGRLLDIGCGGGDLLVEARAAGYEGVGLDDSIALVAHARQRHGLEVHCGDPASFKPSAPFEVVVMSHVLEHVVRPLQMLESVRRFLVPEGILYVATPNIASWQARFAGWASYEPYHFVYFSPSTLTRALEQAGFRVLDLHTWEPLSGWLNTALRGWFGVGYSRVRLAVQGDPRGIYRVRYLLARAILGVARVGSGVLLTPVRMFQESRLKGEELICLATAFESPKVPGALGTGTESREGTSGEEPWRNPAPSDAR
jgi:SAM-dependent methyltransferase